MPFELSKTYLYKLHVLTNELDRLFESILRKHAGTGLSQFLIVMAIGQHPSGSQQQMASFLGFSRPAVKRQVGIAIQHKWVESTSDPSNRRRHVLNLTPSGQSMLQTGLTALEEHAFKVFSHENRSTGFMQHLDLVLEKVKEVRSD